MSNTLEDIAQQLKDTDKKVQLIYAFNGTGKTRLSRAFKELVAPKSEDVEDETQARDKILYYNAFTEDLFSWDNNMDDPRLKVERESFINWIISEQGLEPRIAEVFRSLNDGKLEPTFHNSFVTRVFPSAQNGPMDRETSVSFSIPRGDDSDVENVKISKGEESNFIWSIFYALIEAVISTRNIAEPDERDTSDYNQLEYIFIDDPVSSLDDNHLLELALGLAELIKSAPDDLKFIVTTHNVAFYNHLHSSLKKPHGHILRVRDDGSYQLATKRGASNTAFAYHMDLKEKIEQAIADDRLNRSHFTDLRNLYEKTASFLGYENWADLLPTDAQAEYQRRIVHFSSHSNLAGEEPPEPKPQEQQIIKRLLEHLTLNYRFWPDELPYAPTDKSHR